MVRRLIAILCLSVVNVVLGSEEFLLLDDYRGEAKIVRNYAHAIATYYNANGKMPESLEAIRDNAVLTVDFGSRHAATVPNRYAMLDTPLSLKTGDKILMVSVDRFKTESDIQEKRLGGRMAALLGSDGIGTSMLVPVSMIDPVLEAAGVTLKPIGGEVPAPTFPLTPRKPEMSETMKRALEMQARGELPTPPRRDKETWRDEKQPAPPPVAPVPAPVAPLPAKSSNTLWWIVAAIAGLVAVVLVVRRKKPKA